MKLLDWQKCLEELEAELSSHDFHTWIRPLQAAVVGDTLRLLAPNKYIKKHVNEHHFSRIREIAKGWGTDSVQLRIGELATEQQPGRKAAARKAPAKAAEGKGFYPPASLSPDYTFDSFVQGESNQMAKAAAMHVAENVSDKSYNPLLLYGGVGLGKTHLLHAVGNAIREHRPDLNVLYMYAQRFTEDVVNAIRQGDMPRLKAYYQAVDVLLVDDLQFLLTKERPKTSEEFFHVFNNIQGKGGQMVFTCDRYPKDLPDVEDRLLSRVLWGMARPVEQPGLETREAILMNKAEQQGVSLPTEVARFIAKRIRANVRELEGALRRVMADADFSGQPITLERVRETLRDVLAIQERQVSLEGIQKTVADYCKIRIADLLSKSRSRSVARPRQIAMALAKELTNHSLPEIGDAFGGRDHTTVIHACRKVEELRESSRGVREDYTNLLRLLTR